MAYVDKLFLDMCTHILMYGIDQKPENVRPVWSDGTKATARYVLNYPIEVDNTKLLLPTTKEFAKLAPIRELIQWMWIERSNRIADLRRINNSDKTVWNQWVFPKGHELEGTIGKAYGYQLGKVCRKFPKADIDFMHLSPQARDRFINDSPNGYVLLDQVDYLIQHLVHKTKKYSRRLIVTLNNIDDADFMFLEACVWATQWSVDDDDKLHLKVFIRSNDIAVGNPFNMYQYEVLHYLMCHITGLGLGSLNFDLTNAHIYHRHIPMLKDQLNQPQQDEVTVTISPDLKYFFDFDAKKHLIFENLPTNVKKYDYEVAE